MLATNRIAAITLFCICTYAIVINGQHYYDSPSTSSLDDEEHASAIDDRPDYSKYYTKQSGDNNALLSSAPFFASERLGVDVDEKKTNDDAASEHGFVQPLDFTSLFSEGGGSSAHFENAANHQPNINIQTPFHFTDKNSDPFFMFDHLTTLGSQQHNKQTKQPLTTSQNSKLKQPQQQSYTRSNSELDDLNNYKKQPLTDTNNYKPLPTSYSSLTKPSYTANFNQNQKYTVTPQLFPAAPTTKYYPSTVAASSLTPYQKYSFQTPNIPTTNYQSAASSPYQSAASTAAAAETSGRQCRPVARHISADDIAHGRLRRAADNMKCFECIDAKSGTKYEQCSYTDGGGSEGSKPDGTYFHGHAEKYRTRTYGDHSRRKRSPERKKKINKKNEELRSSAASDDEHYTNPFEYESPERKKKINKKNEELRSSAATDEEHYTNPFEYEKKQAHKFNSRPHDFDKEDLYKTYQHYKHDDAEIDNDKKYGYDPEYFGASNDYKSYSERQSDELKKDNANCKEVKRDSATCMVCTNSKTGGNYEQCSYSSEPNEKQYAYVKEHKYNSNDPKPAADVKPEEEKSSSAATEKRQRYNKNTDDVVDRLFPTYKQHRSAAATSKAEASTLPDEFLYNRRNNRQRTQQPTTKDDDGEESKHDVASVLAEFTKKDRSKCEKIAKDKMTCYVCRDDKGIKHEECMFVSESAPKSSHLAYHELKAFSSAPKPSRQQQEIQEVEAEPTEYIVQQPSNQRFVRRKLNLSKEALAAAASTTNEQRIQVSGDDDNNEQNQQSNADTNREYSPDGAYATELKPVYSKKWRVTLPAYMTEITEGEQIFDQVVHSG